MGANAHTVYATTGRSHAQGTHFAPNGRGTGREPI